MNYESEIITAVKETIALANSKYAERYGKRIEMPKVEFSNKMTRAAGKARNSKHRCGYNTIVFSRPIIELNDLNAFINRTIVHEVAHIVQFELGFNSGHNSSFYAIMTHLGVPNATRCHSYTVPTTQKYTVVCDRCNAEIQIGTIRYNKIRSKSVRYRHNCGGYVHLK
jgi:predicted SprT family Zn-dependent metalloprotease